MRRCVDRIAAAPAIADVADDLCVADLLRIGVGDQRLVSSMTRGLFIEFM